MKYFIIINGTEATAIKANDIQDANAKAIIICNCSKEIIVREVTNLLSLKTKIDIIL